MKRLCLALLAFAAPAMAHDTAHPIDQSGAEHYFWGGANEGWHYLKRDDLSIIREKMVPGGMEENHRHLKSRQFFYVLSGTLTMGMDGRDIAVKAGQGLEVPPGTAHQAKNLTDTPIEILVVSMPPSHGDRELVH